MDVPSMVAAGFGGVTAGVALMKLMGKGISFYFRHAVRDLLDDEMMRRVLNGRYPLKTEVMERFGRLEERVDVLPRVIATDEEFRRVLRHEVRNGLQSHLFATEGD